MAPPAPVVSPKSPPTVPTPRVPPDEQFWQRYSPHHEFPLSGVTSAALHVLVVALLLLAAWVAYRLGWGQEKQPLPFTVVRVEGGGGNPDGPGNGQGQGATAAPVEDRPTQPSDTPRPQPQVKFSDLDPGKADPLALPEVKDEHGQNEYAISDDVRKVLSGIQEDARKKLFGPLADKGPGSGREKGPGHGPGNGPDGGERTGKLSQRQKRVLRWSMTFNTGSGDDYLRQLANIKPGNGAILAIPQADGSFRVLRDLRKRPAVGEVEDVSKIHRIFWVDDKPDSVAGLARALGIAPPAYFVAFFPEELEQELAKREHDYKGRSEERVEETKFAVLRNPDGTYHAQVLSQMGKD